MTNSADDEGSEIDTTRASHGIASDHDSAAGSLLIKAEASEAGDEFRIETMGSFAHGIHGVRQRSTTAENGLTIDLEDGEITTRGAVGHAVYGYFKEGPGNLIIKLTNVDIRTESTEIYANVGTLAHGVVAYHKGRGDIDVNLDGGSIFTKGAYSYGIDARQMNSMAGGAIRITTENTAITTLGASAPGIYARHLGNGLDRSVSIDVGGNVTASGMDAHGIKIGLVDGSGQVSGVADLDDEGYRQQTVTVNGAVTGDAAGVYLAGGGRVVIGPQGTIGARVRDRDPRDGRRVPSDGDDNDPGHQAQAPTST